MKEEWGFRAFWSLIISIPLTFPTVPAPGWANPVAYLKIPGITGDSAGIAKSTWIEVLSCDWGEVPPPRGAMMDDEGEKGGKLCFGNFTILKPVDRASPVLLVYCQNQETIPEVKLELTGEKSGGYRYLVLRKVNVLSIRPVLDIEEEDASEIATFKFRQVEYR